MNGGTGNGLRPNRRTRVELAVLVVLAGVLGLVGVASTLTRPGADEVVARDGAVLSRPTGAVTAAVTVPFEDAGRWMPLDWDATEPSSPADGSPVTIDLTATPTDRVWRGAGAALTDASVTLLHDNDAAMAMLFDPTTPGGAALDIVRLPLSATDFSQRSWTWSAEGVPPVEATAAIDLVRDAMVLRPDLTVTGAAWTAPPQMRTDPDAPGGALVDVDGYGTLLAAQVDRLLADGVPLTAVSLGNEPGFVTDAPTLAMTDEQMVALSRSLAPGLDRLGVELLALDHNWSDADRAADLVSAGEFDAVAFHCYDGDPSAMAGFDVPVLVTECTATTGAWHSSVGWMARELVGDAVRAGSTGLVMWNLALDPDHGPKQAGGCEDCRGLLTIDPVDAAVTTTAEFSVLAHLSAAADPGARIVDVDRHDRLPLAVFANPDDTWGVFGHNDTASPVSIVLELGDGPSVSVEVPSWGVFSVRLAR